MSNTPILHHQQIETKLKRIAWQVLEKNFHQEELVLIGIKEQGLTIATHLCNEIKKISNKPLICTGLKVNKKVPTVEAVQLDDDISLSGKAVILVDDVLNSGMTLAYAVASILLQNPVKVETAILANRDHHQFPVQVTYEGISLATTLKDHITFSVSKEGEMLVELD